MALSYERDQSELFIHKGVLLFFKRIFALSPTSIEDHSAHHMDANSCSYTTVAKYQQSLWKCGQKDDAAAAILYEEVGLCVRDKLYALGGGYHVNQMRKKCGIKMLSIF